MHRTFAASAMSLPMVEDEIEAMEERRHHHHREAAHTAEESVDPRPVHPDSHRLYQACDGKFAWTRNVPIFGRAIECYGPKFVSTLDLTEFMSKGMANYLLQNSFLPMFTSRFGCTAMEFQRYRNVCMMGWSIKPFTALISDGFAVFGYTKRWYMVVSCILSAVCCIIFGLLPAKRSSGAIGAAVAFLAGYGQANLDILSEGMYSRMLRRYPAAGPSLVASLWWMLNMAGIIASCIEGPLSDGGLEAVGAYIAAGCMLCSLPFFLFNGFGERTNREERLADRQAIRREAASPHDNASSDDHEDVDMWAIQKKNAMLDASLRKTGSAACCADDAPSRDLVGFSMEPTARDELELRSQHYHGLDEDMGHDDEEALDIPSFLFGAIEFNRDVLVKNFPITLYAVCMTVGVIATLIATINGSTWPLLIVCCIVSAVLCVMSFWALPLVAAKANLFAFLNQMLYVNIQGPLQTFYTATEDQYPPGPHFSFFFFITTTSIIAYGAMIVATAMFPYVFAKRSYRLTFIITIFAEIVGSIFDLIMVKRWNVDVGIPDHWTYIWGDAVVYQIAYMLAWMPMVVLLSQLCPRGSESIVYALLAGFSNLGQTMAAEIGTLLMDFAWPVNTNEIPFDFKHLPILVIVSHLILPLLLLPAVYLLIPAARICDELDMDGNVIGVKGNTERGSRSAPAAASDKPRDSPADDSSIDSKRE